MADAATDRPAATGEQHEISGHGYRAVVTEVGAALRVLRHDDRDLVAPHSADAVRPVHRGDVLAPWPNRIADGRYRFGGATYQLPVNEVDRSNALHGLVFWEAWRLVERTPTSVVLGHRLFPRVGYPFTLDLEVSYSLAEAGLTWQVSAVNVGVGPAPYGCAPHPYLIGGQGKVDDWSLELPAEDYLAVTPDRLLPVDVRPVAGSELDFRQLRPIGGAEIDHAFTGLRWDKAGRVAARVLGADGRGVAVRWDRGCRWVQVHTADRPEAELHRSGLALEPMTCPPDAFNSGTDLVVLAPGDTHRASWTVSAIG
ncbi:MAG: galactose mutarotase [Micromonosporaceae bacterium]|nr:galactose mutarotase [Micromonosporaceae bacterium]